MHKLVELAGLMNAELNVKLQLLVDQRIAEVVEKFKADFPGHKLHLFCGHGIVSAWLDDKPLDTDDTWVHIIGEDTLAEGDREPGLDFIARAFRDLEEMFGSGNYPMFTKVTIES